MGDVIVYIHPLTGEILPDLDSALAAEREADAYVAAELGKTYQALGPVRERLLALRERVPAAKRPALRNQTTRQQKIDRCPRCKGALDVWASPPQPMGAREGEAEQEWIARES